MQPHLIVLRGNSGSGKSSVATELRQRVGRGLALIGQDNVRRVILKEKDITGAANIGLIDTIARYSLDHGFHTVVEGILTASRYGDMITTLYQDHRERSHFFYLDVPFEETVVRHSTRPQAADFSPEEMAEWYRKEDLLTTVPEHVIGAESTLDDTVSQILSISGILPNR
ncbi:AAA family ATPase [Streptomyces sp. gCLA4]|uniref:AAA family ATPase n=1 Tax=Streptomyces sp. gCLA4 TaxID=1873416 RepID=UPI001604624F|nr:AAA family ATPase [Streptomyces sp. gCLA4]